MKRNSLFKKRDISTPSKVVTLRQGFTLVELLVVVCIIAILIAILLPAISGAHRRAQQAVCMGNARSVAQAVFAWIADNGNFSGRNAIGYADPSVSINQVNSYIMGVISGQRGWAGMPRCPLAQTNKAQAGGYSINFNLLGSYPSLSGIPFSASRTVLISEDNNAYVQCGYGNGNDRDNVGYRLRWR